MSEISKLIRQSSHYLVGQLAIMLAGFISFPILTRIFSVNDYGTLSLITTTILIMSAIIKFGFPNTITRFYSEYKKNNELTKFYMTILIGSFAIAAIVISLFLVVTQMAGSIFLGMNITGLLVVVSLIIFAGAISDNLTTFIRAEQRTRFYNIVLVLRRYAALILGISFTLYFVKGLQGFFFGQVIAVLVILCFLLYSFRKQIVVHKENYSVKLLRSTIRFAFPLMVIEISYLILGYIDRYLIQGYLGSLYLGLYTAGYNLAIYVVNLIIFPINSAMVPLYMNIFVNKGEEETKVFLTKTFSYFMLITLPVMMGFIAVGKNLLIVLASSKYAETHIIFPYIVIGQSIYACSYILDSGLYIRKKTYIFVYVILLACILNIGTNILLIPRFGILGAAQATLISYAFYTVAITYYSFKEIRFQIDYRRIIKFAFAAVVMFLAVQNVKTGNESMALISQLALGILLYSSMILLLDHEIRHALMNVQKTFKRSSGFE